MHTERSRPQLVAWLIAMFALLTPVCAPTAGAQRVTVAVTAGTLDAAFRQLMKQTNIQLVYNATTAKKIHTQALKATKVEVADILRTLLRGTNLTFTHKNGIYTIFEKPSARGPDRRPTVSGTILDERGEPIAGAAIIIKGTQTGTVSDREGRFTIDDFPDTEATIRISYIGRTPIEVSARAGSDRTYRLREEIRMVADVVVTGYQQLTKEKLTGSVKTVTASNLDERYATNIMENLEGRVAGLTIYGGKATIRGTSSLYAETTPLLVVDGIPIEGSVEDINPYDIESINVLKDAAAAAIYGARASNGIIVITTKKAMEKNKVGIDFSTDLTVYEKRNMDYADNFYMTPEQQVDLESKYWQYEYSGNGGEINDPIGAMENDIKQGSYYISPVNYAYYQLAKGDITREQLDETLDRLKKNNYAREYGERIYRRQVMQQYNLALRSRSDKSQSSLTLNYKTDNSGQIETNANLLNIDLKGSYDIASWLTASFSLNAIYAKEKSPGESYNARYTDPWAKPAYEWFTNADGTPHLAHYWYDGSQYYPLQQGAEDLGVNIEEEYRENSQTTKRNHNRYHADLLFKIIDGLTVDTKFVYEQSHTTTTWLCTERSQPCRVLRNAYMIKEEGGITHLTPATGGMLRTTDTRGDYWTLRAQANYDRTLGRHALTALAGMEFRETKHAGTKSLTLGYDEQLQTSATHTVDFGTLSQMRQSPYYMDGAFPAEQFAFTPYLRDGMGVITEQHHRYASGYFNLTYTYDGRYNAFGSLRKDYADVYGLNAKLRGKPLWSVGAGWNIHNEDFLKPLTWINFLKLRVSYGVTGNIYQGATSYMTATSGLVNDLTNLPYSEVESPANPNLRWEQTRSANIGIDFAVLSNCVRGSLDYYRKQGKDIFSNRLMDSTTGFTSMFVNMASMRNTGLELQLTADWLTAPRRANVGWSTSLTFSCNENEVTDVDNPSTKAWELTANPYRKGYPSSALWSYRFAGISDEKGLQGQTLWYGDNNVKAHSVSTASVDVLEYSGLTEPKYAVGLGNRVAWNGFSLSLLMAYYGGHVMRALAETETFNVGEGTPVQSYFLNAWTPERPTNTPGIGRYASQSIGSEPEYGNNNVRPADFIKIRNIVLGYELPQACLRPLRLSRVALRLQIDNPKALWTKNKASVDPETLGIRNLSSYVFGLSVNL